MNADFKIEQAITFAESALKMIKHYQDMGGLGILYAATEQLHQAERELNRAIGGIEK
jgi:hypothetical protein